jgi:thiol-disulfide isomerase/thioredoxin
VAIANGTAGGNLAFGTGLVKMFGGIADSALAVRRLADETVTVDGAARACAVLEVSYPTHSAGPGNPSEGPRRYWIERDGHRLLRVRSTLHRTGPDGPIEVEQVTLFDRVRLGEPVADSLFVFTPPEGAHLVRQWQLPGQHNSVDLTGQDARDFELVDLDGHTHRLSEHKGSVVLLDFWATWCGPCRMTMPLVDKLEREYRKRGLIVYSINLRETRDAATGYIKKKGYGMTTLLDEKGSVGDSYQVNGIPALFIIGKDGKVSAQMVGVQQEEDLREALEDAGLE